MRKSPTILAVLFIIITLARVAEFSSDRMLAGGLGLVFSLGLGAGVYMSGYFTREHVASRETEKGEKADRRSATVQRWSWGALVFFVLADGLFNIAEVWTSVNPQDVLMQIATGVYGVFPTLAAALLGALQGHVDKLPKPPTQANANIALSLRKAIVSRLDTYEIRPAVAPVLAQAAQAEAQASFVAPMDAHAVAQAAQEEPHAAHSPELVASGLPFPCSQCAKSYASQQGLAAHMRKHLRDRAKGAAH